MDAVLYRCGPQPNCGGSTINHSEHQWFMNAVIDHLGMAIMADHPVGIPAGMFTTSVGRCASRFPGLKHWIWDWEGLILDTIYSNEMY